jgi:hypothetical protein
MKKNNKLTNLNCPTKINLQKSGLKKRYLKT